ncbi:hypothetical protein HN873_001621, partial [Arachis hypogaea]
KAHPSNSSPCTPPPTATAVSATTAATQPPHQSSQLPINAFFVRFPSRSWYRCLDLRRQQMSLNILLRHKVVKLIRRYLENIHGFVEG